MRRMFVKDKFKSVLDAKHERTLVSKATSALGKVAVGGLRAADNALVKAKALQPVSSLHFDDDDRTTSEEVQLRPHSYAVVPGSHYARALQRLVHPVEPMHCDSALTQHAANAQVKGKLRQLKLDARAVTKKEEARFKLNPPIAPWYIKLPYHALCIVLDIVYEGRPIQRFWVLEEVARMPYFAYLSMLHLYESLGWWRAGAALRKVHFAEEWNELHHLQARHLALCDERECSCQKP
jgi:ubiquinol oxidase